MSMFDQGEGPDEPNASKSIERDGKGKSIEDKVPLDPVSMSKRNEMTPNGSKRKRKDWRAITSENGGARRRFLRSDMARLHAETEAGAARGAGNGFRLAELEGMDWVKCGDDLQVANGKVGLLNEKVNKESNECGVDSVNDKEVTKIGETEHLGNGELGVGERKEDDDDASGIAGSDFPSGKEVEQLIGTKGKEGTQLLDVTQPKGTDDGGNEEELEGKENENIQCETGEVDASCENTKGAIKIETMKVEAGPTDVQGKKTVEAEEMKTADKQFNVLKKAKKKLFSAKKSPPVQVESAIVERRITRSSAAKQMVNDENALQTDGATIVKGQKEEESSGLDQTDTGDNELLKNLKFKKNKKMRSDRRKSSDLTESDEDFNPVRNIVRKKQGKTEADKDGSVSSGTKSDRPKKPEVESEESDSSGYQMKRLSKKKEPKMEREDSGSNSDFLGSDEAMPAMKKRQRQLPGSKHKTGKAKFGKMIKKKKRQAWSLGSKNKEKIIKVESMSELSDKPRKLAKEIVSGMIKDLLKKHGWKIEMRPRNGRDYSDQVHVSPDGNTHWSITKAYYAFLKERELLQSPSKGKGKQVVDFTPIPEELLDILKRTVCKERCDAKKKHKLKGKKKEEGKWLGVKSKKIKKKEKLKKKIKKEGEKSTSSGTNEMDVGLSSASKKSNPGRGRKKKARLTLLARGSHKEGEASGENDYVPYEWKRTVVSWMIDLDVVSENGKVKYIDPKKSGPLAEGKISRDGIECYCCGKTFTVSDFGVHAGVENGSSCLSYLFVEEVGLHFLQCLVRAWEKQCIISEPKGFFISAESDGVDQNDDTCGVCGDGGDLVCCDECPSTFHLSCLGMEMPPSGDWHCPYCSCVFCTKLSSSSLLSCTQCNDKFHSLCVSEKTGASVGQDEGISFCGESCKKLFEGLEAILGVNHKMEGGFSWRLVRHITEDGSSIDAVHMLEVRAECNSKVAVAMTVMDECFLPIDDQRSGIDLLQNVVYSCKSNFIRLNFRSFYTFLLERDDEIICVASVRVHGNKLAEMPFIGTRYMYRRQGMCRRILDGIESALSSLKVEKLIIPAITELVDTWTNVFGFRPLEGSERQELRSKSIVVFPGTGLLQKPMLGTSSMDDCNSSPREGTEKILEPPKNQQFSNDDMSHEFIDASCTEIEPDDSGEGSSYATASGEGDIAGPSKPDSDVVQSFKCCGGSAEPDYNTTQYGGKLCDGPAELEADPIPAVQSNENLAEPESGSVLVMGTPGKTGFLDGADKIGPLVCEENGRLQGCAENGVCHLTGPQLASTDAVIGVQLTRNVSLACGVAEHFGF